MKKYSYKIVPLNKPEILVTPVNRHIAIHKLGYDHVVMVNKLDEVAEKDKLMPVRVNLLDGTVIEIFKYEEPEDTIRVCNYCEGEVNEVFAGDEGLSVCSGCGAVEGGDTEITVSEYEKLEK